MKKVEFFMVSRLALIALSVICLSLIQSCSGEDEKAFEDLKTKYSLLGENHETGLNLIFEELKKVCVESPEKDNILFETVEKTSVQFTINKLRLEPQTEKEFSGLLKTMDLNFSKTDVSQTIIEMTNSQVSFTPNEIFYLSKLNDIISNAYYGIDQCLKNIYLLEHEIYSHCSYNEACRLFSATSIGANSIVYWYDNYDLWCNELGLPALSVEKGVQHKDWFWASLNRMGKADIAGGLVGGFFGALVGGIGAIPGALAGACTASGNCGLVCLYEHLTE